MGWGEATLRKHLEFGASPTRGARKAATAAKLAGVGSVVPEGGASAPSGKRFRGRVFGGEIDPLRLVVWALFGTLVLAVWAGLIWLIWRAGT